jgi:cysteine desulfurase
VLLYLDANAGVPARQAALRAYGEAAALWGNPSSVHRAGRDAAAALAEARARIGAAVGAGAAEVVLTSGGTEADALALRGTVAAQVATPGEAPGAGATVVPHVVTTGVEHAAVADTLRELARQGSIELSVVGVGRGGRVDPAAVLAAVRSTTRLVSVVAACNETGVVQPVTAVAGGLRERERRPLLHTDAAQAVGRLPVDIGAWGVDLLTLSGHKLGAVAGSGALIVRRGTAVSALLTGGGQERGLRAGTENVAGAASLAAVLDDLPDQAARRRLTDLRDRLEAGLGEAARAAEIEIEVIGAAAERLCNTTCVRFAGCPGEAVMMGLDARGIAVSTGSACSSGSVEPSAILLAMGLSAAHAKETVRFSLPFEIGEADVERAVRETGTVLAQVVAAPI